MKSLIIKLAVISTLFSGFLLTPLSMAATLDCNNPSSAKDQIQCGACDASGAASCNPATAPKDLNDTTSQVINIISVLAGAVAVVMIVLGGFRYITSAGNAENTKAARNTILYAVIGLVIIALAQIVVHFVLNNTVNGSASNTPTNSGSGTSGSTYNGPH